MTDPASPRVLLVDDEADFLESLGQRLALRGLPVVTAASGPRALEIINTEEVDVVVLDVRMPGMDGIECLRRIKEGHPHIEVVMLTGHADLESSLEGMRFGFFDYLTKPVRLEHLIEKIQEAFERGRGEQVAARETFTDKLQEHMIVADRLASLGELAASIAHEINNPLAIISESAGWLRSRLERGDISEEELKTTVDRALSKIESAVDRAARISQNFLSFSRGPDTIVRSFDLGDLAAEVRELTLRPAVAANIEINVRRAPSGEGTIVTDPYQLRQVLLNLVTNALHADRPRRDESRSSSKTVRSTLRSLSSTAVRASPKNTSNTSSSPSLRPRRKATAQASGSQFHEVSLRSSAAGSRSKTGPVPVAPFGWCCRKAGNEEG